MSLSSRLIFNIHLLLGLACALFLVVMGLTGSFLAYEYSIDRMLNPRLFHVSPQPQRLAHNGTAFGAPFQFCAAFTGLAVPLLAITEAPQVVPRRAPALIPR